MCTGNNRRLLFAPAACSFLIGIFSIASCHGSATSATRIYCKKIILHGTGDGLLVIIAEEDHVNLGWTTSRIGQASHCRVLLLCIAHDISRWATIAVETSVGVPQRRLRVLVVWEVFVIMAFLHYGCCAFR